MLTTVATSSPSTSFLYSRPVRPPDRIAEATSRAGKSGWSVRTVLKPITMRGSSNFDSNASRAGRFSSTFGSGLRGGSFADGIGPNSFLTRARASSGSKPPTITRAALLGWYHLS